MNREGIDIRNAIERHDILQIIMAIRGQTDEVIWFSFTL